MEFLWYIPNQVAPGHRLDDDGRGPQQPQRLTALARLTEDHGWGGALIGTGWKRPDTFTVSTALAARHHDVQPAHRDPPRLLGARALRLVRGHARPAQRRPGQGQHRLRPRPPAAVRRRRGRPGPALRPDARVHAARTAAVDRGRHHLRRRALPGRRAPRSSTSRSPATGSPHPQLYFGGASEAAQRTAAAEADVQLFWGEPLDGVAARIDHLRTLSAELDRDLPPLEFGLRITTLVRDTTEEAWADAEATGRRDGRGPARVVRPTRAAGWPSASSACSTSPSRATCSTTASTPRPAGRRRRRRHHLAGRLARRRRQGAAPLRRPRRHPLRPQRHAVRAGDRPRRRLAAAPAALRLTGDPSRRCLSRDREHAAPICVVCRVNYSTLNTPTSHEGDTSMSRRGPDPPPDPRRPAGHRRPDGADRLRRRRGRPQAGADRRPARRARRRHRPARRRPRHPGGAGDLRPHRRPRRRHRVGQHHRRPEDARGVPRRRDRHRLGRRHPAALRALDRHRRPHRRGPRDRRPRGAPDVRARRRARRRREDDRGPQGQEDRLQPGPGPGRARAQRAARGRPDPGRRRVRRDAERRRRLLGRARRQAGRRRAARAGAARRPTSRSTSGTAPPPSLRACATTRGRSTRRPPCSRTPTRRPRSRSTSAPGPRPSSGSPTTPTSSPRPTTSTTRASPPRTRRTSSRRSASSPCRRAGTSSSPATSRPSTPSSRSRTRSRWTWRRSTTAASRRPSPPRWRAS